MSCHANGHFEIENGVMSDSETSKFDCSVHEMLLIRELTPSRLMSNRIQFEPNYLRDITQYCRRCDYYYYYDYYY